MANTLFVFPYKKGSRSAVAIAKGLEGKLILLEKSNFKPSKTKVVINWGSTSLPQEIVKLSRVINLPEQLDLASNKLKFFNACLASENSPKIPEFTINKEEAISWLEKEETSLVLARTSLTGHSGQGIIKLRTKEEFEKIKEGTLLVKYVRKKREFRLHVSKLSGVFIEQEKLKRLDFDLDKVDFEIRNHDNGFIFAKNQNKGVPDCVIENAKKALAVTGLDFGAVDVIYNENQKQSYVLEINSAPGLEGSTLDSYLVELKKIIEG